MRFVRVGDVCGQAREAVRPGERPELRYIGLESIASGSGEFVTGELSKTPETPQANSFRFGPEHVLYGKLRPYLNKVVLPCFEGKCSTEIIPLLPNGEVERAYLAYFLRSQRVVDAVSAKTAGARMPRADMDFVFSLCFSLPPLEEQRRIVDLLSRAEGIVRLRREAEKKAAELIPALFLDMFGDPATNPKGWPIQSLKNLVSFVSGGTPSKSREDFWEGDLPWVSPKDMKRVGIDSAFDHVNRKVLTETAIKLIPVGSVLVVVRGMILVHTVPVAQSLVPMTINQDMKALVPIQSVNGTYLLWSLRVRQGQLLSLVTTAAHGTKKMETERLEAFSISLPPLAAQEDFAGKLASIESIQSQQSAATAKAQATFDALLAQALAAE